MSDKERNKVPGVPPDTEAKERDKYERMWRFDQYRKNSPGVKHVQAAIDDLHIKPGDSVYDFGCGTGRATLAFSRMGIAATGIDIAANCLDPQGDFKTPFVQACLWDLPSDLPPAYAGYCTDVMEHIPPEYVDDVLRNIKAKTLNGVFFQICCRPDGCGSLIGETLHLTVQPSYWWADKLATFWDSVDLKGGRDVVAICQ